MPVKPARKMSSEERREVIIQAVRKVFVEKGFHGTTTRELARAAGVSEALLFKHFPSKEALYHAMQISCFKRRDARDVERLRALEPSTASLVELVHDLVSHIVHARMPDDNEHSLLRLILRSLTEDGEFARLVLGGGPTRWTHKVGECLKAAQAAGDATPDEVCPRLVPWFTTHAALMTMIHLLPDKPVVHYGASRDKLVEQLVWFSLRGMGVKDEAIRRNYHPKALTAATNNGESAMVADCASDIGGPAARGTRHVTRARSGPHYSTEAQVRSLGANGRKGN